jgi:hypothetical protein
MGLLYTHADAQRSALIRTPGAEHLAAPMRSNTVAEASTLAPDSSAAENAFVKEVVTSPGKESTPEFAPPHLQNPGAHQASTAATSSQIHLGGAVSSAADPSQMQPEPAAPDEIRAVKMASSDGSRGGRSSLAAERTNNAPGLVLQTAHVSSGHAGINPDPQPSLDVARVISGAQDAANTDRRESVQAGISESSRANASIHEAFAALDGGAAAAPAWTHAGPHTAEAGFRDPALGWVGVRARADAAGVHAVLVPNSQDAAQPLGSHISALSAYLAEHHTQVASLSIAAPESHWVGQNMEQPGGRESGEGTGHREQFPRQTGSDDEASRNSVPSAEGETLSLLPQLDRSEGAYISVIA